MKDKYRAGCYLGNGEEQSPFRIWDEKGEILQDVQS